jgi:hypothetical protein
VAEQAAPPRVRVRFDDAGDPLAALAREALVRAGAVWGDDAAIVVRGDGPLAALRARPMPASGQPTLALNNAALVLFERDGATLSPLALPQFGRALDCEGLPGGILEELDHFRAGIYATHIVRDLDLPPGWRLAAAGADGRVAAAVHPERRIVALVFRPDAVLSLYHASGQRALVAALGWLAQAAA